jgi:hypothetical protein
MQESFDRKNKNTKLSVGASNSNFASYADQTNKSRQKIIEEPHQTTEYDVDDLIKELSGEESWRKRLKKNDH